MESRGPDDGDGGTDLTLTGAGGREVDRLQVTAGWVSVCWRTKQLSILALICAITPAAQLGAGLCRELRCRARLTLSMTMIVKHISRTL